jgi:formylglycine-generating enzyme required for sulfatase activity
MQIKKTILLTTLIPSISLASSLEPPAPPDNIGSAMYSIWDICKRLETGAAGEKRTFQPAPSGPVATNCSLNDIMDKAPAKSAVGVSPNEVPAGKKYWGLTDGNWGLQTGTASANTDPNLKPENIRAGVTIFGVVGTYIPTAGSTFRDTLKDGSSAPAMVMIPAGSFRMGDIQGGGYSSEQPVHSVSVGQFAMGKFEVTFAEYDKFADATGRSKPDDQGWGRGNRPVINVSWNDATEYTEWLSNQTGFEANVFFQKTFASKTISLAY